MKNPIVYIIIYKRSRNSITSVKTHPGADIKSDHNLFLGTINLKKNSTNKNQKTRHKTTKYHYIKQSGQYCIKEHLNTEEDFSSTEELRKLHITPDTLDRHLKPIRKEWMKKC